MELSQKLSGLKGAWERSKIFFTKSEAKIGIEAPVSKNRIPDEVFLELRKSLETDPAAREAIDQMLVSVIARLEPFYLGRENDLLRLRAVGPRILVAIEPARRALETTLKMQDIMEDLSSYFNGQYDLVMMQAEPYPSQEGLEEVLMEEVMHFMKPLPEEMLMAFDKAHANSGKGFFQFFNEGATLYYLRQILGRETHVDLKRGMAVMIGEGTKRDMGAKLWAMWCREFGEKEMHDFYFGRVEPKWLAKKLNNWDWWKVAQEIITK